MENYSHNTAYASGSREPRSSRATTVRLGNARRPNPASAGYGDAGRRGGDARGTDATGVLRSGERQTAAGRHAAAPRRDQAARRSGSRAHASTSAPRRQAQRPRAMGASAGAAAAVAVAPGQQGGRRHSSNFMHYANDNRVVRAVYEFTHGSTKPLFIAIVIIAALVSLYFPVRDLYVAKRTGDILAKQVAIRKEYNDSLQKDVDKLLSEQGIKDTATDKLGLVMPGEKKIDVVGLDDGSSSSSSKKDTEQSKKSSEVAKAEQKVAEDAPWYVHALDTVFGFKGVEGQEVTSTGN